MNLLVFWKKNLLPSNTSQDELVGILEEKSVDPSVTGIIIQQPFPPHFNPQELFQAIPFEKEIEGHKPGSTFLMPIALSVLTAIKWLANEKLEQKYTPLQSALVNLAVDAPLINQFLRGKNIVILGRGPTGGAPVAKAFDKLGVSYTQIHSQTENPDSITLHADIIISAVGKKILNKENLKPGVVLLNLGLHHDGEKLMGDYAEDEVESVASYHTQTPGGLGPIDVLYLYANLIEAAKKSSGFA